MSPKQPSPRELAFEQIEKGEIYARKVLQDIDDNPDKTRLGIEEKIIVDFTLLKFLLRARAFKNNSGIIKDVSDLAKKIRSVLGLLPTTRKQRALDSLIAEEERTRQEIANLFSTRCPQD